MHFYLLFHRNLTRYSHPVCHSEGIPLATHTKFVIPQESHSLLTPSLSLLRQFEQSSRVLRNPTRYSLPVCHCFASSSKALESAGITLVTHTIISHAVCHSAGIPLVTHSQFVIASPVRAKLSSPKESH
jgi:hypothetical protein